MQKVMDMKRKVSRIWNFFTPINEIQALCKICHQTLKYKSSITNLKAHLVRKHPTVRIPPTSEPTKMIEKDKVLLEEPIIVNLVPSNLKYEQSDSSDLVPSNLKYEQSESSDLLLSNLKYEQSELPEHEKSQMSSTIFNMDQLPSTSPESKSKKRKRRSSNRSKAMDLLDMLLSATVHSDDSCTSDSELSLDNDNDQKDLNNSSRNVYSNFVKVRNGSSDAKDTDSSINFNHLTSTSCVNGNKLRDFLPLKNIPKLKKLRRTKNEQLNEDAVNTKMVPAIQSAIKFSALGGLDDALREICRLMRYLKRPDIYKTIGMVDLPRGFLLHGPPGCGKTMIAHAIAGELELPLIKVAATELVSDIPGESESRIQDLFKSATLCAPSILFIDKIDAIAPKREFVQKDVEKRIISQLLMSMDELSEIDSGLQVMVIGATNRLDSLDPALRKAGRFGEEIGIKIPNETARLQILDVVCCNFKFSHDFSLQWLARNTPGYVGADLKAIAKEAANVAVNRIFQNHAYKNTVFKNDNSENETDSLASEVSLLRDNSPLNEEQIKNLYVKPEDFEVALQAYVPLSKREGFATVPNVTWDHVGALKDVRRILQEAILWPIKYEKEFNELHLTAPIGILLCGPKGCGKSLLAKAVANEGSINFLYVRGPELLNLFTVENEQAVQDCFQRAKHSAPCIVFFDEIDALWPSSSNGNPAAERIVNQLLTEIDGIDGRENVFIVGATNQPDNIDSDMLRPGRMEKVIFIDLPDQEGRLDILQRITKGGTRPKISDNASLKSISSDPRCHHFSGADLASLVKEASFKALREYITHQESTAVPQNLEIKQCHFENAFTDVKPSTTPEDRLFFKNWSMKKLSQNCVKNK